MKVLPNTHLDEASAYVVEDYPYGFQLRCRIRYWLEFKSGKGFRFVSQTSNPKKEGLVWNKPKKSNYVYAAAAMYLDDAGHVQWCGLTEYETVAACEEWIKTYGSGVPQAGQRRMAEWVAAKKKYEQLHTEGKVKWVIRERTGACIGLALLLSTLLSTAATVTAYCPCQLCCGPGARGVTASGKPALTGTTIAAPRRIPFGTRVYIPGVGVRIVQDRLAKKYDSRFDVFFARHEQAKQFGRKELNVRILN